VRLVLEVAGDRGHSTRFREAIAEGRGRLFDNEEPVTAVAESLLQMAAGKP
jgi:hypothetical protein